MSSSSLSSPVSHNPSLPSPDTNASTHIPTSTCLLVTASTASLEAMAKIWTMSAQPRASPSRQSCSSSSIFSHRIGSREIFERPLATLLQLVCSTVSNRLHDTYQYSFGGILAVLHATVHWLAWMAGIWRLCCRCERVGHATPLTVFTG